MGVKGKNVHEFLIRRKLDLQTYFRASCGLLVDFEIFDIFDLFSYLISEHFSIPKTTRLGQQLSSLNDS